MTDVILRYTNLPSTIHAYTIVDENDDYNIYVNANIGIMEQEKAKMHELQHIQLGHFYNNNSALENESEVG